jgi:hypothetical protein
VNAKEAASSEQSSKGKQVSVGLGLGLGILIFILLSVAGSLLWYKYQKKQLKSVLADAEEKIIISLKKLEE